jgi:cytoskeletal protein CcmA (bactofilin family)
MAQARTANRDAVARIGSTARIRGRIQGEGDLVIEGQVQGDVALRGDLTITDGASLSSDVVEAHAITVAGSLEAEVSASGPVQLAASARVRGNLRSGGVSIEEGAHFVGRLECEFDLPPELGGTARPEGRPRSARR